MRHLASLAASVCLTLAGCAGDTCGQPQQVSDITLMPFGGNEIAPVVIDGVPTGMLLDTGADGLTVTPQAVADLKLETHSLPMKTSGIDGGEAINGIAEIHDLKFGGAEIEGAAAAISPLSASGLTDFPVYGLFGEDVLTNWDIEFDAAHDKLALFKPQQCSAPTPPWTGRWVGVDIPRIMAGAATRSADVTKGLTAESGLTSTYSGQIVFPVTLDGHTLTAQLDTGADHSAVSEAAVGLDDAALRRDRVEHDRGVNLVTVEAHRHAFGHLVIGGTDNGPLDADVGDFRYRGIDMLLGEDFLRQHRVYIAFQAGQLLIAQSK